VFTVGIIKPSTRPGKAEELAAILPEGIAMEHANLSVSAGTREQLERAIHEYDAKIEAMVALGVDLVHAAGVSPLLLGYRGEQELVRGWEQRYGRPVFTNGMSQVNALRAFKAKRVVGVSYFPGEINRDFAHYLEEAGFEVLEMTGMEVAFQEVPRVPPPTVRQFIDACVARHRDADALYMLGPAWRTLDMVESLESAHGMPVIHHIPAQSWEIQRRSGLRRPVKGYGRLVAELP
jgi:maleate isomerase